MSKTKTLEERLYAKFQQTKPKTDEGGTFEVTLSNDNILADIKYVLTTGIKPFDDIIGGFPFGRISEIYGLEASGKTALMVRSAIRAKLGHIYEVKSRQGTRYTLERVKPDTYDVTIVYVDNEQSLEDGYKIEIVNVEYDANGTPIKTRHRLDAFIARCDTVEYLFKIVDETIAMIKTMQKETEKKEKDSGDTSEHREQFVLIIVDTIAGTSSKEEMTQEWGKDDYNRQAKQYHSGFRTMKNDLSRYNVAMLCTNQATDNIGGETDAYKKKFLPPDAGFRSFGGKALKFYATHRIFMKPLDQKYTLVRGAQFAAGALIEFYSSKNRIRKPKRSGRMVLLYDEEEGGLHTVLSILETLILLKFVEYDEGEYVFKFEANKIETTTFNNEKNSLEEDDEDSTPNLGGPAKKGVKKPSRRPRDPRILERAEWMSFYHAHKADFDLMYEAALNYAFTIEGLEPPIEVVVTDAELPAMPESITGEPVAPIRRRRRQQLVQASNSAQETTQPTE